MPVLSFCLPPANTPEFACPCRTVYLFCSVVCQPFSALVLDRNIRSLPLFPFPKAHLARHSLYIGCLDLPQVRHLFYFLEFVCRAGVPLKAGSRLWSSFLVHCPLCYPVIERQFWYLGKPRATDTVSAAKRKRAFSSFCRCSNAIRISAKELSNLLYIQVGRIVLL